MQTLDLGFTLVNNILFKQCFHEKLIFNTFELCFHCRFAKARIVAMGCIRSQPESNEQKGLLRKPLLPRHRTINQCQYPQVKKANKRKTLKFSEGTGGRYTESCKNIILLLPPANEVCEGYVFTRVCHSVHRGGVV